MSYLTRAIGAAKLAAKANAPTIMVVSGVVSMTAGAVLGAKQTLKVEAVLEKHTPALERIAEGQTLELESYGDTEARADRIKVYTRTAVDLGKLYFFPATLFVGGAGLVFGGHRIMIQRNATLAIAFTTLKKSFDSYRGRVTEKLGDEADQAFMNGAVLREVIDPETGQVETIATRDWESRSGDPYARIFQEGATSQWEPDLSVNRMFLVGMQKMAQQKLNSQGYLYLNDVYESLGFPKTDIGQVVGWKERVLPDGTKNIPFVDFGLDKPMPEDWKYAQEAAIYLDFNCQGLIVGGNVQKLLEKA